MNIIHYKHVLGASDGRINVNAHITLFTMEIYILNYINYCHIHVMCK